MFSIYIMFSDVKKFYLFLNLSWLILLFSKNKEKKSYLGIGIGGNFFLKKIHRLSTKFLKMTKSIKQIPKFNKNNALGSSSAHTEKFESCLSKGVFKYLCSKVFSPALVGVISSSWISRWMMISLIFGIIFGLRKRNKLG